MFQHEFVLSTEEKGRCMALAVMRPEYIPIIATYINEWEYINGTLQCPPYTRSSGVEWVRKLDEKRNEQRVFAILVPDAERKDGFRYVGHTGLHRIDEKTNSAVTGSIIGDKSVQGIGVGTEAKLWLQYYAYEVMGLRKLHSFCKAFNAKSMGHLIKCGYTFIGRRRAEIRQGQGFIDELLFECFPVDWEPIWAAYQETGELPKLTDQQRALIKKQTENNMAQN
jgi:RimJ/RimL family protein N-acetyltransferase